MHAVWRRLRSPFRVMHCTQHSWEQYDVDKAGCKLCGISHECKSHVVNSTCPLVLNNDCSVCCSVTGMIIASSNCAQEEFSTNTTTQPIAQDESPPDIREHVHRTLQWFLQRDTINRCMQDERTRIQVRFSMLFMKEYRYQIRFNKHNTHIIDILATTLQNIVPGQCLHCSHDLYQRCCANIIQCIIKLGITHLVMKKSHLIVGLLYMMKQGLIVHNTQLLPKIPFLSYCLPHESMFSKYYMLSTKLLCETENEVKLAIRTISQSL